MGFCQDYRRHEEELHEYSAQGAARHDGPIHTQHLIEALPVAQDTKSPIHFAMKIHSPGGNPCRRTASCNLSWRALS
eukprot:3998677-Amphidinium_carterae.1